MASFDPTLRVHSLSYRPVRALATCIIVVICLTCGAFAADPTAPVTAYSALTTRNTSAGLNASTAAATTSSSQNVSKIPISSLLPTGASARIYAHLLTWFGTASHQDVGYSSADPAQIKLQVEDMLSRGINGVIINWHGSSDFTNQAARLVMTESESHAGSFEFSIEEDGQTLAQCAATSGCDLTAKVTSDLNYILTTYTSAVTYMKYQGHPVIFLYGMEAYQVDWDKVRAGVSGTPVLMFRSATNGTTTQSASAHTSVTMAPVTQDIALSKAPIDRQAGVTNA